MFVNNKAIVFKKGVETVQRYRYLYKDRELKKWVEKIKMAGREAQQTFVLFNNCFQNYGIKNAKTFGRLICGGSC